MGVSSVGVRGCAEGMMQNMPALILAFLLLLLVLTGTFLTVLGVLGWIVLFILGAAIAYLGVAVPIRNRFAKSDQARMAKIRAALGYEVAPEESPEQQRRKALGYTDGDGRET